MEAGGGKGGMVEVKVEAGGKGGKVEAEMAVVRVV